MPEVTRELDISCSICGSAGCALVYVAMLTITVCWACGNMHIAETDQYIALDLSRVADNDIIFARQLFAVAKAMESVYQNWDSIRPNIL